jgi:putative endonuclease
METAERMGPVIDLIMNYVYVLRSKKDGKWYTGCTESLRKRFSQHNDGKVASTRGRGPFELIY